MIRKNLKEIIFAPELLVLATIFQIEEICIQIQVTFLSFIILKEQLNPNDLF